MCLPGISPFRRVLKLQHPERLVRMPIFGSSQCRTDQRESGLARHDFPDDSKRRAHLLTPSRSPAGWGLFPTLCTAIFSQSSSNIAANKKPTKKPKATLDRVLSTVERSFADLEGKMDRGFAAVAEDITDIKSKMATKDDIADVKSTLADHTKILNDHTRDLAVIKNDVTTTCYECVSGVAT